MGRVARKKREECCFKSKKPPDEPGRLFSGSAAAILNSMDSLCMSPVTATTLLFQRINGWAVDTCLEAGSAVFLSCLTP